MINILLVERDMESCKKLIANISKINNEVRIFAIANTIKEIKYSLNNYDIDIIILHLDYNEYLTIKDNKLISESKYKNSVILILEKNISKNKFDGKSIYNCITNSNDINKITNTISNLVQIKQNDFLYNVDKNKEKYIKECIKNELEYLGYSFSYSGTSYLLETIYTLSLLKNYCNDNLEKDIYPLVGAKFHKSAHTVKCNIRNATDMMTYECEEKKLQEYLYEYEFLKPGPKRIIYAILGKLKIK